MSQITKTWLNLFIAELRGKSNATVNRYVSLIRASLRWGVRQGYLKENPLRDFSRLRETRPFRSPEITQEDLKKLFSIPDQKFKLFLQILYWTLARKREILSLTWEDIDLKRRTITFRQTKRGVPKVVPVCDSLHSVLEKASPKEGRLFSWKSDYVTRKFQRLRDRLSLSIRGIHEFRHARASELLRKGANPRGVQELLGHKSSKTTMEIYARISLDGLRETVSKL